MGVVNSKIVTDNLIFAWDSNNVKSFSGPAIRNVASSINALAHGSGTGYSFLTGTEVVYIPGLNTTLTVPYSDIQNTGASWCCPNPFSYGGGLSVSPSTTYTYMIVYKSDSGYTNGNYMYRYEYNGGTSVTEAGVFDDAKRIDLGNGWYWAWNTFTTQASTNLLYPYAFYYRYSNSYDRLRIAYAGIFAGDYTKMNPLLWPALNTTRSTTGALVDSTGNYTITINSMGYDNSGNPVFTPANSNYISAGSGFANFTTGITGEFWAKFTANYTWERLMDFATGQAANNIIFCRYSNSNDIFLQLYDGSGNPTLNLQGTSGITNNQYAHYTFTINGTTAIIYKNGVPLVSTNSSALPTNVTRTNTWIGRSNWSGDSYFGGSIDIMRLYNKALSSEEVLQNYNANKSRFGL